jgi:hypothetical protein
LKNTGAGEGNRTVVFSLEGFRRLSTFKANSDKKGYFRALIAKAFFAQSERRMAIRPGDDFGTRDFPDEIPGQVATS